jgi:hypothetical protein
LPFGGNTALYRGVLAVSSEIVNFSRRMWYQRCDFP